MSFFVLFFAHLNRAIFNTWNEQIPFRISLLVPKTITHFTRHWCIPILLRMPMTTLVLHSLSFRIIKVGTLWQKITIKFATEHSHIFTPSCKWPDHDDDKIPPSQKNKNRVFDADNYVYAKQIFSPFSNWQVLLANQLHFFQLEIFTNLPNACCSPTSRSKSISGQLTVWFSKPLTHCTSFIEVYTY